MAAIKVVAKDPAQPARVATVDDSLESLQALVGGNIELVRLGVHRGVTCDLWLNEDGHRLGLTPNVYLPDVGAIVGPVFIAAADGEETVSLPEECITAALEFLNHMSISG